MNKFNKQELLAIKKQLQIIKRLITETTKKNSRIRVNRKDYE